ncbi:MAG TPA: hypothetical protein VFY69_04980 [Solirubrobacterales bacterium]|nr:hypothetical protein [Solirubrobacterales bacterium]
MDRRWIAIVLVVLVVAAGAAVAIASSGGGSEEPAGSTSGMHTMPNGEVMPSEGMP